MVFIDKYYWRCDDRMLKNAPEFASRSIFISLV